MTATQAHIPTQRNTEFGNNFVMCFCSKSVSIFLMIGPVFWLLLRNGHAPRAGSSLSREEPPPRRHRGQGGARAGSLN